MQSRQRDHVAPVGLDPLVRPFRDQSRSDHQAIVAESPNLAIKPLSRRPGFKADMQPVLSVRQIGHEGDTAHSLERRHDGRHGPGWSQILDFLRQASAPLFGVMHAVDIVVQDNLLRRVGRSESSLASGDRAASNLSFRRDHEGGLQMLTRLAKHPDCRCARPDQIPHSLMGRIRNPNGGQFDGAGSFASITASRRSVLIRSPAFIGISEGATTTHSWPRAVICRCNP
jgi:hypothetical protein